MENKQIWQAMVKAHKEVKPASKNSVNSAYGRGSKYADLESVWNACRDALHNNDLSIIQAPVHSEDDRQHLKTIIFHSSGETIEFPDASIPVARKDAHGHGAAITYLKRFALASAMGIVSDPDDDGNTAMGDNLPKSRQAPAKPAKVEKEQGLDSEAIETIKALAKEAGSDMKALLHHFKVTSLEEIPLKNTARIISGLQKKIKDKESKS